MEGHPVTIMRLAPEEALSEAYQRFHSVSQVDGLRETLLDLRPAAVQRISLAVPLDHFPLPGCRRRGQCIRFSFSRWRLFDLYDGS